LRAPINKVINKKFPNFKCYAPEIFELSKVYDLYKRDNHLYDYDDLIDEVIRHLKANQGFKNAVQKRYKQIMVDEYQDTNLPQKELIDILAEQDDCSLMVVGDDNQSIYAFRGANYQNILLFGETFKNAKLIKLEQNYRSSSNILNFINDVSNKISLGYQKSLFTSDKSRSAKPEFLRLGTEEQEAKFIADKIIKLKNRIDYKEIAVLCRASFHSNFVQAEFLKRNIPFIVVGGIKFIEKRHIKDILAYMKILWNPLDAISWHRVLTILPGIGNVTANKITQEIKSKNGDISSISKNPTVKKEEIKDLYEAILLASKAHSLIDIFQIIEKYYTPLLKKIEEDWKNRIEDFKVLKRLCVDHENLEKFLSNLALDPPNDSKMVFTSKKEPEDDAVTISTVHSAKGLEWNTVFFISLIDGAVPHYKSLDDFEQLEEERKLFYVGCSRAKENLFLTAPSYFATYSGYFDKRSRFIDEVNSNNYKHKDS
jgi:DNA helicase-2/ATP-dependent DNA helicase PcrA